MRRQRILKGLAPGHLIQPATALWRVYELEAVARDVKLAGRVLDLGCGDGSLSRVVLEENGPVAELIGLELDPSDAELARGSGIYTTVHTAPGDRIPEPDESFDMVFSNSVLEHIPELEPVLADVSRVLRRGGSFVLTVPSEFFHACLGDDTLPERVLRRTGESTPAAIDRRLRHYRYWSEGEWRERLGAVGLDVRTTRRYFPREAVRAWQRISGWTGGLAFELLGRKSEMRSTQRRLGLNRLGALMPAAMREALLARVLRNQLAGSATPPAHSSGGLLIVAEKR